MKLFAPTSRPLVSTMVSLDGVRGARIEICNIEWTRKSSTIVDGTSEEDVNVICRGLYGSHCLRKPAFWEELARVRVVMHITFPMHLSRLMSTNHVDL